MPASSAVPPALMMPAAAALSSMSPERRVSLPMMMFLPMNLTAAWPRRYAISQVSSVFATPRTPSVPKSLAISVTLPCGCMQKNAETGALESES